MYPEPLFHLWGRGVNIYLIMALLAPCIAAWVCYRLCRERFPGLEQQVLVRCIVNILTIAGLAGLAGGRLFCFFGRVLEHPGLLVTFSLASLFSGCMTVMGGVVAALPAVWFYLGRSSSTRDIRPAFFDLFFPSLALFQSISRTGCLAAGCCYGRPAYDLPWAITFSDSRTACAFHGIPVHPTQIYLMLGHFMLFLLLYYLARKPALIGRLAGVYLVGAGLLRFVVEFYRGDFLLLSGLLSYYQWICLAFIAVGTVILSTGQREEKQAGEAP